MVILALGLANDRARCLLCIYVLGGGGIQTVAFIL